MGKVNNLTGQRFGRLITVCPTKKRIGGHIVWLCRCDCGNLTAVANQHLRSNRTKSCGCLRKERTGYDNPNFKHGDAVHRERSQLYTTWIDMKQRCSNLNAFNYRWYGEKGISVCNKWKNNYLDFKNWALKNGYKDSLTIDRINNRGNYEPDNCQWLTNSDNLKKRWSGGNYESI